jgi:hypothetical protein
MEGPYSERVWHPISASNPGFCLLADGYKVVLYHAYGTTILIFLVVLFVNLFGAALTFGRRFFLKSTGRKLSHLDKQFNASHTDMPIAAGEEDFN